jgi:hypothetical protein
VAHLKNSSYFIGAELCFALAPFHCVMVSRREARLGHAGVVRDILAHQLILGHDIICLSPAWLLGCLLPVTVASVVSSFLIMHMLRAHPKANSYSALLLGRSLMLIIFCLTCLLWYSRSLPALSR